MRTKNPTVSATEASRSFSDLLNKVYYKGKTFDIKRGREIIAQIKPATKVKKSSLEVGELKSFFARLPALDKNDIDNFESDLKHIRSAIPVEGNPWE